MNFETNSGYANPLVYVAFKQLVALDGKGGDSIAISLLNSLVPDFQSNPLQSLESATLDIPIIVDHGMRPLQMDFHAVNSCGEHLILELQLRRHIFFDERILFYATRTYSHQIDNQTLATGSWHKKLKKTYAIQILDYDSNKIIGISDPEVEDSLKERIAKHPMKTGNFIKHYLMTDRFSGQEIDHLQIIQVELPRAESLDLFPPDKNFTEQRWWLSILNHSKEYTEEYIEKLYKEEIMPNTIYEGLGRIKLDKWTPNLLQDYNREVAEIREFYAPQIAMDMKDAEERGIAIGEERGKRETALSMLADGMSVATVSKYTGLSTKELEQLKAQ
ncbi:hypothetical protein FACS1894122_11720 [Alphaproteobacteria bacterium]|nr:hypothetical protein FACS1894122_11720 [Alphaproteobacteria bacterium]